MILSLRPRGGGTPCPGVGISVRPRALCTGSASASLSPVPAQWQARSRVSRLDKDPEVFWVPRPQQPRFWGSWKHEGPGSSQWALA